MISNVVRLIRNKVKVNGKCLDDEFVCLEDVILGFIMVLDG